MTAFRGMKSSQPAPLLNFFVGRHYGSCVDGGRGLCRKR